MLHHRGITGVELINATACMLPISIAPLVKVAPLVRPLAVGREVVMGGDVVLPCIPEGPEQRVEIFLQVSDAPHEVRRSADGNERTKWIGQAVEVAVAVSWWRYLARATVCFEGGVPTYVVGSDDGRGQWVLASRRCAYHLVRCTPGCGPHANWWYKCLTLEKSVAFDVTDLRASSSSWSPATLRPSMARFSTARKTSDEMTRWRGGATNMNMKRGATSSFSTA